LDEADITNIAREKFMGCKIIVLKPDLGSKWIHEYSYEPADCM
jgi:hypothetical protein